MAEHYGELYDFVVAHYVLSARRDSAFWRAYTEDVKVSDRLAALLALWKHKLPGTADIDARRQVLSGPHNCFFILAGQAAQPGGARARRRDPQGRRGPVAIDARVRAKDARGGGQHPAPLEVRHGSSMTIW